MKKVDPTRLEINLKELLAKNNHILAVMKEIESSEIPPEKTALEVLVEELGRRGLLGEVASETER